MYNQTGNLYQGVFDCLYKTVRTEGLLAIYKGYFAHLARILPHTVSETGEPARAKYQSLTFHLDLDTQFGGANQQVDAQSGGPVTLCINPSENLNKRIERIRRRFYLSYIHLVFLLSFLSVSCLIDPVSMLRALRLLRGFVMGRWGACWLKGVCSL